MSSKRSIESWADEQSVQLSKGLVEILNTHICGTSAFVPITLVRGICRTALCNALINVFAAELDPTEVDNFVEELSALCEKFEKLNEAPDVSPNHN